MSSDEEKKIEFEEETTARCWKSNLNGYVCWCGYGDIGITNPQVLRHHWKLCGGAAKHLCEWAYEEKQPPVGLYTTVDKLMHRYATKASDVPKTS